MNDLFINTYLEFNFFWDIFQNLENFQILLLKNYKNI